MILRCAIPLVFPDDTHSTSAVSEPCDNPAYGVRYRYTQRPRRMPQMSIEGASTAVPKRRPGILWISMDVYSTLIGTRIPQRGPSEPMIASPRHPTPNPQPQLNTPSVAKRTAHWSRVQDWHKTPSSSQRVLRSHILHPRLRVSRVRDPRCTDACTISRLPENLQAFDYPLPQHPVSDAVFARIRCPY